MVTGVKLPKVRRPPRQIEHHTMKAILDYLRLCEPGKWWRQNRGGLKWKKKSGTSGYIEFAPPGCSDILGCWAPGGGRFVAIEVKDDHSAPTEDQLDFLDAIRRANGLQLVARSVQDVKAMFDRERALLRQNAR